MEIKNFFDILEIEVTKDEDAIKKAYREALRKHNPEDDPEGFKAVRAAYEKAIAYATATDDAMDNDETDVIKIFINKLVELYSCYRDRINPAKWEELLSMDVVDDIETAEEVRNVIFSFLPDHYLLPNSVYEVIDHKYFVGENFDEIAENCDEQFLSFFVAKASNRYHDFEYETLAGTPDHDHEGVVDQYIEILLDLMRPDNDDDEKENDEALDQLATTGLLHPWFILLTKRRELLRGNYNDQQLKDLFEEYIDQVPEKEHQIIYPAFEYRVNETRAIICKYKDDVRGAFYYYRLMDYIRSTKTTAENLAAYGKKVAELIAGKDEMDVVDWHVFLEACKHSEEKELAVDKFEAEKENVLKLEEYDFIFAAISEFYADLNRTTDAIKALEVIPDSEDNFYKDKKLSELYFEVADTHSLNSTTAFAKLMEYGDRYQHEISSIPEKDAYCYREYFESLMNMMKLNLKRGLIKEASEQGEKLSELLDGNPMEYNNDDWELNKIKLLYNIGYTYLLARKNPTCEFMDKDMTQKAAGLYKEAEKFAAEAGYIYYQIAFLENLAKCYYVTKNYEEAVEYFENIRSFIECNKSYYGEETFKDFCASIYEKLISFHACLGHVDTAREYLEKLVGKVEIPEVKIVNGTLDFEASQEKVESILKHMVFVPEIFEEGERERLLFAACSELAKARGVSQDKVKGYSDYYNHIALYAASITKSYKKLQECLDDQELLKVLSDDHGNNRHIYTNLARLAVFAGDKAKAKEHAAHVLEEATLSNKYCTEYGVTLEEAVEDGRRYNNRFELSNLTEIYLYLGDLDKARYYLAKMDSEGMCAYCTKNGCIEKYINQAQISLYEGDYATAAKYAQIACNIEWHCNEEIATAIKKFVESN